MHFKNTNSLHLDEIP
jgi:ubiquitin C-terminal hydrolase